MKNVNEMNFYTEPTSSLLISCIDCEYLEIDENSDVLEKLKAAKDCFYQEMGWAVEKYNQQTALKDWLMGLCSAVSVPYKNTDILQWGEKTGYKARVKDDSLFIDEYWNRVSRRLSILFNRV